MEIKMYERTFLRCVFILFVVPKSYYIFLCINYTDPYNRLETCSPWRFSTQVHRMAMLVFRSRFLVFNSIPYKWLGNPISEGFPRRGK